MKITAWVLQITDEEGNTMASWEVADMPDDVSQVIDNWLAELESGE